MKTISATILLTLLRLLPNGGFVSPSVAGEATSFQLNAVAPVSGDGVFLPQLFTSAQPLPAVKLCDAPAFGKNLILTRDQISELLAANAPALGTNFSGAEAIKISRRARTFGESDVLGLLTAALQQDFIKDKGQLELRLAQPWNPLVLPDEPLTLDVQELPTAGVTQSFILRFALRTPHETLGTWTANLKAGVWREVCVAIMNLCVNARDAMPNGGTLTISLKKIEFDAAGAKIHPKAKPGSYVVISVSDTGTGIPPELLDKIFDPFFTTKPLGQGTGLGLPTVLGITENHGGFVHLESQPGCGTTFHIHIPAAQTENETAAPNGNKGENGKGNSELILVVDDEPAVRRLASAILNRHGYRTITAAEGREGAAMFAKQRDEIRLVISDVMMPQLDGPGMLRELKILQPGVKSIVITGLGEENRIADAKAAGADVVLQKPFTADELLTDVKRLLS